MHNDKRWQEIYQSLSAVSHEHKCDVDFLWVGNYRFPSGVRPEYMTGIECKKIGRRRKLNSARHIWHGRSQVTNKLESEELSFFQGETAMPILRMLHRWIAGNRAKRFEEDFAAHLHMTDVDFVIIPNGRIAIAQVAAGVVRSEGLESWFIETNLAGFANPVIPASFYLKKFPIHQRELLQAEILLEQPHQEDSEIFHRWLSERATPESTVNSFSKTWSSNGIAKERLAGLGPGRMLNVFFTSSTDEFTSLGQEWNAVSWANQYEAFACAINELAKNGNDSFVVRVHPNLQNKDLVTVWRELVQITRLLVECPQVELVLPDSKYSSYQLIDISDRVFVSVSSIGLEASGLGKPVWSFYPNYYDNVADVRKLHSPGNPSFFQTWDVNSSKAHFFAHQAMRLGLEYESEKNLVNDNSFLGGVKAAGLNDAWFRFIFVPYRAIRQSLSRFLLKTYSSIWKHLMTFGLSMSKKGKNLRPRS